jgi:outer membrane murein-binding lipoprotein Lpp
MAKFRKNMRRIEMKTDIYILLFILLTALVAGCQSSQFNQLEATNQALNEQVNTLSTQLTLQSSSSVQITQQAASPATQNVLPTELSQISPSPLPAQLTGIVAPSLIFSGSGAITPWTNKTAYPIGLFGAANVHLVCDPNASTDGKLWIDNQSYTVNCTPNSESWYLWKQDITVGDHYIYSDNANDKYEFWTSGTTPFTIKNKFSHSDYMFRIPEGGIYNLSANVTKGVFNLYITCEGAQNFNYSVNQSTTISVVLNPARCELLIRDSPPGTLTPGEIEVSLEFLK